VVVNADHKVFEAGGDSFGVGQVEVIGFDEFNAEKAGLLEELIKVREAKGLVLSALLVTDIVCGTSLLLATGKKEVIYNLGYPKLEESMFELKGVISRKKQVVPHLLSVFNTLT
jgi:manganese-dependent inorganic pyrophosphatase